MPRHYRLRSRPRPVPEPYRPKGCAFACQGERERIIRCWRRIQRAMPADERVAPSGDQPASPPPARRAPLRCWVILMAPVPGGRS